MSSHHSQESVNLHHDQVTAGKARRLQGQVDRLSSFLSRRKQLRTEYNYMLVLGFICFAYVSIATAVYTRYLIF